MIKRSPRFWNHWTTEGEYKGLSESEQIFLKKFNKEWTAQTFGTTPLHNVKQRQELAHSEYARRNDAMNATNRLTERSGNACDTQSALPELIDSHRLMQKKRKKLIVNEKAQRKFLNTNQETTHVRRTTKAA